MAEKRNYYIKLHGLPVPVEKEVYETFHRSDRHLRTLQEKDERNGVVSYDALDSEEMLGEDMIPDLDYPGVEDMATLSLLQEKLKTCLTQLDEFEQKLIYAIFYEEKSIRQIAKTIDMPVMTVYHYKMRALGKLKKLMDK